jgi:hypothetical protein
LGRPPVPPLLGVGVLWSPGDRAGAWRRTARARGGRCRERWTSGGVSSAGSSGWPRRRRTGTAGPTCWRTEQSREVRRARGSISSPPRPVVGARAGGADVDDGRGACRSAWQRPAGLSPWARRTVRPRGGGSIATPGPQRRCRGLRTPGWRADATWPRGWERARSRQSTARTPSAPCFISFARFQKCITP